MRKNVKHQLQGIINETDKILLGISSTINKQDHKAFIYENFNNKYVRFFLYLITCKYLRVRGFWSFLIFFCGIWAANCFQKSSFFLALLQSLIPENTYKSAIINFIITFLDYTNDTIFYFGAALCFLMCIVWLVVKIYTLREAKIIEIERTKRLKYFNFRPTNDWFSKVNDLAITGLGPRYSAKINFHIPSLSQIYHSVLNDTSWLYEYHDHLRTFLKELQNICSSNIIISDQTDNLAKIASEIQAAYAAENPDRDNISSMARSAFELCCNSLSVSDKP